MNFKSSDLKTLFHHIRATEGFSGLRIKSPCSPISHHSDASLLVCYNKNHGLPRELPCNPAKHWLSTFTKPRWIPKCTNRNKLGHQQVVHIPHSLQAQQKDCVLVLVHPFISFNFGSSFQISISCELQRCVIDSAHDKPANPSFSSWRHTQFISTFMQAFACSPYRSVESYYVGIVFQLFRPFLLMVGNPLCLVMLCLISARRDKVCPQYRVRNWHNTRKSYSSLVSSLLQ